MTKNDKQQDLFARQRKGNQTKEILTSIDIGSDKIICLIAKSDQVTREKRAIRVIGSGYCQSKGIRNGRIVDANEAEKSIRLALDKAEKTANIEVNSINLCISGDFIDSHIMKGNINISENAINQEHVYNVISSVLDKYQQKDKKILHIVPSKFFVDGTRNVPDPTGLIADNLGVELNFIAAEKNPIINIENLIHNIHLDIDSIVAKPYASGLACLYEHELDFGSACIDIGCGTTSVSIFYEGTIVFAKTINIGGWYISHDISIGLSTPFIHAEGIKNLYGSTIMGPNDSEQFYETPEDDNDLKRTKFKLSKLIYITRARFEEIINKADKIIEDSGYSELARRNIVLTGGTADLNGAVEITERMLDTNVRKGTPMKVGGLSEELNGSSFSASCGVLLHSLSHESQFRPIQNNTNKLQNIFKRVMGVDF